MLEAKDTRRKCSKKKAHKNFPGGLKKKKGFRARKRQFFAKKQTFSKKKSSSQIFCEILGVFQDEVKKRSWSWLIFNQLKKVLSSSQGQDIFEGLYASRPRRRTSKCVLEAKDVLKNFSFVFRATAET